MAKKIGRPVSRLVIEGRWQDAVGTALTKKRPAGGWPSESKPKASKPKARKKK